MGLYLRSGREIERRCKRGVQAALRRAGIAIGRYPYYGTTEARLAHVLKVLQVTNCLDVGAHHGEFGDELRSVGYAGQIVSFEPASSAFAVLARHTEHDPLWSTHRLALGALPRVAELNLFDSTDFNSIHGLTDAGRHRTEPVGSEPVVVERLDKVWDRLVRSEDRVFLKIDTQGSDLEVLSGAGRMIGQVVVLQLEATVNRPLYERAADLATTIDTARSHGFLLSNVSPVALDHAGTELVEVDLLFVREGSVNSCPLLSSREEVR